MKSFNANLHFSSSTDDWSTPQDFFDKWNHVFHFELDACASYTNHKCENYFTIDNDGLSQDWAKYKYIWMNPPYGRTIGDWMKKAYEESLKGCVVVCLVPAKTDTKWWHDYAKKGVIYYIKGRLKFGGSKTNAPFPSAVIIFMGHLIN